MIHEMFVRILQNHTTQIVVVVVVVVEASAKSTINSIEINVNIFDTKHRAGAQNIHKCVRLSM